MDSELSIKSSTTNESWFKRNGTNFLMSLLTAAIIGSVGLAQHYFSNQKDQIKALQQENQTLKHDFDLQVQKRDKDIEELKQRDSQHDDELKEHDNAIDRNREDIIRVQDYQQFKK